MLILEPLYRKLTFLADAAAGSIIQTKSPPFWTIELRFPAEPSTSVGGLFDNGLPPKLRARAQTGLSMADCDRPSSLEEVGFGESDAAFSARGREAGVHASRCGLTLPLLLVTLNTPSSSSSSASACESRRHPLQQQDRYVVTSIVILMTSAILDSIIMLTSS